MTEIDFTSDTIAVDVYKDRVVVTITTSREQTERQLTAEDARSLADALNDYADQADDYDGPDADKNL